MKPENAFRRDLNASGYTDPIPRLAANDLPNVLEVDNVEAAIECWLATELLDDDERELILHPLVRSITIKEAPLQRRERALFDLLRLVIAENFLWLNTYDCRQVVDMLEAIQQALSPTDAIMAFLRKKAAAWLLEACEQRLATPALLRDFLTGTTIELLDGDIILLPFNARLPLGAAIEVEGIDGVDLWHLRAMVSEQAAAFDAAVSSRRAELESAVEAGLRSLFEEPTWKAPIPVDYLAAFGALLSDGAAITVILSEIEPRIKCKDGFEQGPDKETWFGTLAGLHGWRPEHVRSLLHLDRNWTSLGDVAVQAALAMMEDMAALDRGSAAMSAFHVHRIARWMAEEGRALADIRRQKLVEERMRKLPDGSAIMLLSRHLAALPLPVRSQDCVWEYFGNTTKAIWCDDVGAIVEEDAELAKGLAEFLIAFTEPEAFDDVEPFLFELLHDAAGIRFLDEVSDGAAYLAAMRARSIRQQMLM